MCQRTQFSTRNSFHRHMGKTQHILDSTNTLYVKNCSSELLWTCAISHACLVPLPPFMSPFSLESESERHSVKSNSLQLHGLQYIFQASILEWVAFLFSGGIFPIQVGSHFISPGHLLSSIYLGTSSSVFLQGFCFAFHFEENWIVYRAFKTNMCVCVYIYIFLMYMYVCVFIYFWKPSTSPPQFSEWRCHKPQIFLILLYLLNYLFIYVWTCQVFLAAQGSL